MRSINHTSIHENRQQTQLPNHNTSRKQNQRPGYEGEISTGRQEQERGLQHSVWMWKVFIHWGNGPKMEDKTEGAHGQGTTHTRRHRQRQHRQSNRTNEHRRRRTSETQHNVRTTNQLERCKDSGTRIEDDTEEITRRGNNIERKGEGADTLKRVQSIRTLATCDIPIHGDLNKKNHCVCHLRDIIHGSGTYQKLSIQVLLFSSSNYNVFYF